jgi:predicted AlkP superfamily phosphohydrolase/phosphomutase
VTSQRKRVLVIGLDGATFDLIEPWGAAGHLPNLARLMREGARGRLASTLQPVTAPAWVTFMTGVNQGKHGLYDFVRRRVDDYGVEVTNAVHVSSPTLFDIAGQADRRVIAVNVPYTFPPRPVNGVVIGGPFATSVTPDLVYPRTYFEDLKRIAPDYFILPQYDARAADPLGAYAQSLLKSVELRERVSLHLMKTQTWDLFAVVFMDTDEVQHTYWNCQDAPNDSPLTRYRHTIRDVYQRVDQAIGAMLAQVAEEDPERETIVIILSDHGGGPLRWLINLNVWLAEQDYLRFREDHINWLRRARTTGIKRLAHAYRRYVPTSVRSLIRTQLGAHRFDRLKGEFESALSTAEVDWEHTRAYALGSGGNVFINLHGREPRGTVAPGAEYERLRDEVAKSLLQLRDPETGQPVVRRVFRREELYHGPFLDQAADLIIEWADYACWGRGAYDSQAPVFEAQRHFDFSDQPLSGAHRPDGILIAHGPDVQPGARIEGARLLDLAPTILAVLGLPIPNQFDGRVLEAAFVVDGLPQQSGSTMELIPASPAKDLAYTPEEELKIVQHLQDLGYL